MASSEAMRAIIEAMMARAALPPAPYQGASQPPMVLGAGAQPFDLLQAQRDATFADPRWSKQVRY